jgi:hypothetical protein
LNRDSRIGTIVGASIGGAVAVGAVVIGIIVMQNRRKGTAEFSEDSSSDSDIREVADTVASTVDGGMMNYQETFTYEGGPSTIYTVISSIESGNDRSVASLPLI